MATRGQGVGALAVALAALLGACGGASCPTRTFPSGTALLAHRASVRAAAPSLRAEARVEQWGKKGRVRGTVLMFVERPNRVRFDVVTQFGPVAILTSDGDTFALTDLEEKRFVTGPACPRNIERLVGLPLTGEEMTSLLLGDLPVPSADVPLRCGGNGWLEVRVPKGETTVTYAFETPDADLAKPPEAQRQRLRRITVKTAGGKLLWRASFDRYTAVPMGSGSLTVPFEVRVEHPSRGADTTVRFERMSLGVAVPEGAFRQAATPGLAVDQAVCD